MKKEIKKVLNNFELNCGWKSIIRFMNYVKENESKKNYVLFCKLNEEFEKLDNFGLIKNFSNFKKYCLSK